MGAGVNNAFAAAMWPLPVPIHLGNFKEAS
jgi:hypothetical protein